VTERRAIHRHGGRVVELDDEARARVVVLDPDAAAHRFDL